MTRATAWSLALALLAMNAACRAQPALREGDLVFQTSRSRQSLAIQRATRSRYSHVGLITMRGGEPYVLEAAARVQLTPLAAWIARGEGQRYVVKRLRDAASRFTPERVARARALARSLLGRPYDSAFDWSDARMYCSELVWKLYARAFGVRLGEPKALRDYDLHDPIVRAALARRYGAAIPLDAPMVAPAALLESELLEPIHEE